jgi:hypothetical protein
MSCHLRSRCHLLAECFNVTTHTRVKFSLLIYFKLIGRFHETQSERHAIEYLIIMFLDIIQRIDMSLSVGYKSNWASRHGGVLGEWMYSSTHSLTSALDGGGWSASRPGHFTPRERAPGTNWIGGLMAPRAILDAVVKRKIPSPRRESDPRTPIVQPAVQRYTDWAIASLPRVYCIWITRISGALYEGRDTIGHRPITLFNLVV